MRLNLLNLTAGALGVVTVLGFGTSLVPVVFADRVLPDASLNGNDLSGINHQQLPGVIAAYNAEFKKKTVRVSLRGIEKRFTLEELGVDINNPATVNLAADISWLNILRGWGNVRPQIDVDSSLLNSAITQSFSAQITPPKNASLVLMSGKIVAQPSASGESVDLEAFRNQVSDIARTQRWETPIELAVVQSGPSVLDNETQSARIFADKLLTEGITLTYKDSTWDMKPFTIQRLLNFDTIPDPTNPVNEILGVSFDRDELKKYLAVTISPQVEQVATDARFERKDGRVVQFAVPQEGRELDVERTADIITAAISAKNTGAEIAVNTTSPNVKDLDDIQALGVSQLLATGESDFVGSPANRVHNITTGTDRYHGLLLEPGQEFSFNQFLGPVDAEHGYKPELVIKTNMTVAEYGGGLCQVSTTLFRAAVNAGLEITQRRNHAYAVRYYGTPGFDATIYPPYTDLRFINNTPGYILIQARIDGTKLQFELWGTDDGREVEVTGPVTYDRQPDGSVKATVKQRVTRNGEVLIDESFYSRYRSPDLYPKVQGSSTVSPPPPAPTNDPTPTPNTATNPAKSSPKTSPKASAKPSIPSS